MSLIRPDKTKQDYVLNILIKAFDLSVFNKNQAKNFRIQQYGMVLLHVPAR